MALGFAMNGPAEGRMQDRRTVPAMNGAPMPEQMTAPEAGEGDEQSNVSPEEQAVYDQVVGNALKIISSPKTRGGILQALQGDGNPEEGLANAAATVAKRVIDSAEKAGMKVPGDIMLPAGQEIVEALAEVQRNAGIADLDEKQIEGAFMRGLDLFREMAQADGTIDRATFERDFQAMAQADKAGRLDEMVPGASKAAAQFGQDDTGEAA
jgi:hypothetical protein